MLSIRSQESLDLEKWLSDAEFSCFVQDIIDSISMKRTKICVVAISTCCDSRSYQMILTVELLKNNQTDRTVDPLSLTFSTSFTIVDALAMIFEARRNMIVYFKRKHLNERPSSVSISDRSNPPHLRRKLQMHGKPMGTPSFMEA